MTPTPPSSSEGSSLPPRHRPSLGNLAQDTTELDLWAFEDDLTLPGEIEEPRSAEPPRPPDRDIPAPRERQGPKPRESDERQIPKTPVGGDDRIRMNVNKVRVKNRPAGPAAGQSKPEKDFDELENWEDAQVAPEIEDLPVENLLEPIGTANLVKIVPQLKPMPVSAPVSAPVDEPSVDEPPAEPKVDLDDEFSPVPRENATPVSLRPHLGLSKVERLGMAVLVVMLLIGSITVLIFSLKRLPTESKRADANDFPIKGSQVTIASATSYWRTPIIDGATPDTFRRDTKLLPVLEVAVSGGPAAIRVMFRNEERTVVGDAVTRTVHGEGTLKIPATAGFDDIGMHAAYRTGESKPWTIEVFEAPSETSAGKDFKKLFEMNISTDRH